MAIEAIKAVEAAEEAEAVEVAPERAGLSRHHDRGRQL